MDSNKTTRSAASATANRPVDELNQDGTDGMIVYDDYEMKLVGGMEDAQRYNEGGYHPVHLDDVIDGRFEVVHKLGSGGFGIVWLCRDIALEKWRAVKIMAADQSARGTEEKILNRLRDWCTVEELDENHIVVPLEQFWLEGPNGRHLCLVMPVHGMTISDWRGRQGRDGEDTSVVVKDVCSQIIQSLSFLHSRGICHGDFKPGNILMKIDGIDDLSKDEIIEIMGDPVCYELETASGEPLTSRAPEYCVIAPSRYWSKELVTKSIVLVDFGESFFVEDPPESTGIPSLFGAPEVYFGAETGLGFPSDVWSLACTLFEIRAGIHLFADSDEDGLRGDIHQIEFYLGPLPPRYRKGYRNICRRTRGLPPIDEQGHEAQFTSSDALPEMEPKPATWSLDTLTESRNSYIEGSGYSGLFEAALGRALAVRHDDGTIKSWYQGQDVLELSDLLRKMLKYDPTERISVDEVKSHPWISPLTRTRLGQVKPGRYLDYNSIVGYLYMLMFSVLVVIMVWVVILRGRTITWKDWIVNLATSDWAVLILYVLFNNMMLDLTP
ncbi:CAAX geranylgeranyltransferase alpha subunit [Hypoxylon texense]